MVPEPLDGHSQVRTVCEVLVGRDEEVRLLTAGVDAALHGNGSVVVLRGEPGIGKSRLGREALERARARSMATLVGRCVEHGQTSYRPFAEALLARARTSGLPDVASLRPFRAALGTLVPDWSDGQGGDASPLLIGEGVLRLSAAMAGEAATLLVVEDLHWADRDTLATVEYLADSVGSQRLLLLATLRARVGPDADALVSRLGGRSAAQVLELGRLREADVSAMVTAWGGGFSPSLVDSVVARSEGVPLFVEELLSVPAAALSRDVPSTFLDAVTRRLTSLAPESDLVVRSGAVLGRRFDWRLLPAVSGLTEEAVRRGLDDAVEVQLLVVDGSGDFSFRHALTRDAVLAALLPPARADFARRAAEAICADAEDAADADQERLVLAAELWHVAGRPEEAARLLLTGGRHAVARGALRDAERLFGEARLLPVSDLLLRAGLGESLTEAQALAAKVDDAMVTGTETLGLLEEVGASASRRGRLHLLLARAADTAGRRPLARHHIGLTRHLATEVGDGALLTRADALAAHVAIGEHRLGEAERLATAAVERALEMGAAEVACEALEVLGRRERLRDLSSAAAFFERAHELARDHDLPFWTLRTQHELGTIDMLESSSAVRLQRAGELAYAAGNLPLAATVDLQLTGLHAFLFDVDAAVTTGARAVDVAATLGLTEVHASCLLQVGFAHAIAGRRTELDEAVGRALQLTGEQPQAMATAWGHARATASLLEEDRDRALEELDAGMTWAREAPGATGVFTALWALLRVAGGGGPGVVAEARAHPAQAIPVTSAITEIAQAVVEGRCGRHDRAGALVSAAEAALRARRMRPWLHLSLRLAAEGALEDGWGTPARWLQESREFFDRSGHARVSAACRDLLRRAGLPSPGSTGTVVPSPLDGAGVTSRELEVLRLVGERLSNREVAERLYLSPRTVEKHVEHLLRKTGRSSRGELGRLARHLLGPPAPRT